jgi:hypothetical protein
VAELELELDELELLVALLVTPLVEVLDATSEVASPPPAPVVLLPHAMGADDAASTVRMSQERTRMWVIVSPS